MKYTPDLNAFLPCFLFGIFGIQDPDYDGPEPSDWEKYAAEDYEMLVAEDVELKINKKHKKLS